MPRICFLTQNNAGTVGDSGQPEFELSMSRKAFFFGSGSTKASSENCRRELQKIDFATSRVVNQEQPVTCIVHKDT